MTAADCPSDPRASDPQHQRAVAGGVEQRQDPLEDRQMLLEAWELPVLSREAEIRVRDRTQRRGRPDHHQRPRRLRLGRSRADALGSRPPFPTGVTTWEPEPFPLVTPPSRDPSSPISPIVSSAATTDAPASHAIAAIRLGRPHLRIAAARPGR